MKAHVHAAHQFNSPRHLKFEIYHSCIM